MAKKRKSNKVLYILIGLVVVLVIFAIVGKSAGWIGKAKEIELLTEAESKFHKTLSEVLTASSLRLRFIERWNGILPKVTSGNGGVELTLPPSVLEDKK